MSSPDRVTDLLAERGRERRALGEALRPCVNLPDATFEHGPGCECGKAAALRDSLQEQGRERRQMGRDSMSTWAQCRSVVCRCFCHSRGYAGDISQHKCITGRPYVSTASRAEPTDALQTESPIGERDLAYALEEALLTDGDRRRAFAVLVLWKEQQGT